MPQKINWNSPVFGEEEIREVTEVLRSGYVSEGPKTKELEKQLSQIVKTKHIIMTTSCTAALYLAIEADKRIRGYGEGEVIIPDLTMVGTKNAVEMAGLEPMILDVDRYDFCLANFQLRNAKVKIVIPVNLFGRDSKAYNKERNSVVPNEDRRYIFDNAGCLGSKVYNGTVGCYSLQANKIISCGQGGFCATDSDEYAEEIRKIKDFGRSDKEDNHTVGFNLKFNDILAGVALGQLKSLEQRKTTHLKQYALYKKGLKEFGRFIDYSEGEIPLWVEFGCISELERNALIDYLKDRHVEVRKPWKPFLGLPNAAYYANHYVWLPTGFHLTEKQIYTVINSIQDFYKE